ncbi:hypothetical protein [Engelhardtia mirabilis]|uniref:Uncharacterized protein n=1 Tax=Engelhardtia mirabilis TaxID=2528011 RepID=A0A518BJ99_9BACT|nr:hypothetical protein Pla133_21320 [Planctomycetes bacterium Pla133]QDV01381.1 hypothetical protein Pla86_21320 [Planctomycetes bacterium Pla86]
MSIAAVCCALALVGQSPPQESPSEAKAPAAEAGAQELVPGALPAGSPPEAQALWSAMVDALREPARRSTPIEGFQIHFDLRARAGLQTNDLQIEARYLRPDCLALELPSRRAIGIGPAGPWLRESDGSFLGLVGREYASDQRMLQQTLALAKNYLALSAPHRVRLASLIELTEPPANLPDVRGLNPRFLDWVEVVTPDFNVLQAEPPGREGDDEPAPRTPPRRVPSRPTGAEAGAQTPADASAEQAEAEPMFRVAIGIDRKSHLPEVLVLSAVETDEAGTGVRGTDTANPAEQVVEHCIRLREFRRDSGLYVPWRLDVYQRWPHVPEISAYSDQPAQEIDLINARLSTGLERHEFIPPPWR